MSKCRGWCFTVNNYTEADEAAVKAVGESGRAKYVVCGREKGEQGTPHLQGYVYFDHARSRASVSKMIPRAHLEAAKGSAQENFVYCSKEEDFFEIGARPQDPKAQGPKGKAYWDEQLALAKAGNVEACDSKLQLSHFSTLNAIAARYAPKPVDDDWEETPHVWYYGPTGSGKTRLAKTDNPSHYVKNCDEWWQGYAGEECVIIDDFDKYHVKMGYNLKRWADHGPFVAYVKGSSVTIRPKKLVVTSNYKPSEIWDDPNTLEPIMRRFKLVHVPLPLVPLPPSRRARVPVGEDQRDVPYVAYDPKFFKPVGSEGLL